MSVEITKHVKIVTPLLTDPLEITMDAAIELRDALIVAFPLPISTTTTRSPPEKWVLKNKTWYKGTSPVSTKMVKRVVNVVGKEWKLIDDIADIVRVSRPSVLRAADVLVQEGKLRRRGIGKTTAVQSKSYERTPQHDEIPKISVVDADKEHNDFSALDRERKLKREQMRQG